MTLYAHVTGTTVDAIGRPPEKVFEGGRWWDLRPMTADILNPRGWFAVTTTMRPADTPTTTTTYAVTLVAGVPTETWTPRPWTVDELAARTEDTNEQVLRDKSSLAITANATYLAITAPTNAQNLAQIRALTRQATTLIRLEVRALADTGGTL